MNLLEVVIVNTIYCLFPLMMYLFYLLFNKNCEKKENDLILDISLLTSLYLLIRFTNEEVVYFNALLLNIPLVISFLKRRLVTPIIISIIIIMYTQNYLSINITYLIIGYSLYYLIYYYFYLRKPMYKQFISIFLILKYFNIIINISSFYLIFENTLLYIFFVFSLSLAFKLFNVCENITKYYINKREIEEDKKVRSSIFRITHEIKNPIAVCKGYLDMFDVNNIEHSKKYVPIMKSEINRTLLLLQDFLAISKIKVEKDYMDVNILVEDVMNNFNLMLKEKNIKTNIDLVDDDIYILGDYNRLMQVLMNVIKNSIEAIPSEKAGNISIKTDINNNNFYLEISDNGVGIKDEVLKKIGEPFFTTKVNGTGLGVSLSKQIIKAHDGIINYENNTMGGTSVKIFLPITN